MISKKTHKRITNNSHSNINNNHSNINNSHRYKYYDIIIIGGGISGLYCAYNLLKSNGQLRILLLEKGLRLGGRVSTFYSNDNNGNNGNKKKSGNKKMYMFETGAARFNDNHKLLNKLLNDLHLDNEKQKIDNVKDIIWYGDNKFINERAKYPHMDDIIKAINTEIKAKALTSTTIRKYTLQELAEYLLSNNHIDDNIHITEYMESLYPYNAEQYNMNAYDALQIFNTDFTHNIQYYMLKCGLSEIIKRLQTSIINMGCDIITSYTVSNVNGNVKKRGGIPNTNTTTTTNTNTNNRVNYIINNEYTCNSLMICIPKLALKKVAFFRNLLGIKLLNSITCIPLYRIYAKYPLSTKNNKVWFTGINKVIVNHPIKFIMPYDEKNGILHISYTDGKYAKFLWKKFLAGTINSYLDTEIKKLFPDKQIPKPQWIKHYYWECGMGSWNKNIDSTKTMIAIIKPSKSNNIYFCGENYSNQQGWMEGALFTSNIALTYLKTQINNNKTPIIKPNIKTLKGGRTLPIYTIIDVNKHNKKGDAWLIIKDNVYNVTDWIDKHPGGDIIMKGVGKDATTLFEGIGHSSIAKKQLKTMLIGTYKK